MIQDYCKRGTEIARNLPNRGLLRFDERGQVDAEILASYRKYGFYIFEGVVSQEEISELRDSVDSLLRQAPTSPDSEFNSHGEKALGSEFRIPSFKFAKPLSDPYGGTDVANGRYEAKMSEPTPKGDAPSQTIFFVSGPCQLSDEFLRHYGNPGLLQVAESVNGSDFTPFTDAIWIKEPELGTSVAWHQDGMTLWDREDWHEDIHGFNFMTNLYETSAENALWVVPETHKLGKIDIKKQVEEAGTDRLPGAVPMLCQPGDVAICNRQVLHGSFANTSTQRRVTLVHGFHLRKSVLGASYSIGSGKTIHYDNSRVHRSSRLIQLAIDARSQHFDNELPYMYQPLKSEVDQNRFNQVTRESLLKDYNLFSLGL